MLDVMCARCGRGTLGAVCARCGRGTFTPYKSKT